MPDLELQPHQRARADRMVRILELTSRLSYAAVVTPDPDIIAPFVRAVIASACQPGLELRVRWIGWTGLTETTNEIESMMNEQSDELRVVIVDLSQVRQESLADARNFAARINLRRDPFARRFVGLFMLCLPDWLEIPMASAAPDLWSVMTVEHLERSSGDFGPIFDEWWTACDLRFDDLLKLHPDRATPYQHGTCTFAYVVEPGRVNLSSTQQLRDRLDAVRGYTNWRPWWVPTDDRRPTAIQERELECWMAGAGIPPGRADFWRASGLGKLYLRRGYDEDSNPRVFPVGTKIATSIPIKQCAEAILHARDFCRLQNLQGNTRIELGIRWTGLDGRTLTIWPNNELFNDVLHHRSRTPEVTKKIEFTIDQVDDELPAIVERLTEPLFERFDLYRSPPELIAQQLANLK